MERSAKKEIARLNKKKLEKTREEKTCEVCGVIKYVENIEKILKRIND